MGPRKVWINNYLLTLHIVTENVTLTFLLICLLNLTNILLVLRGIIMLISSAVIHLDISNRPT